MLSTPSDQSSRLRRPAPSGAPVRRRSGSSTNVGSADRRRAAAQTALRGCGPGPGPLDGVPVDPKQVVACALIGRLRVIAVDGAGVIVSAGRKRNLFTGALRESIMAIDPVCGWLGCNLRAQISAIDHLEPRSRGGPTDAANGKVMCDHHNIFKHVNGYAVERSPDGTIEVTRPDGSLMGARTAA